MNLQLRKQQAAKLYEISVSCGFFILPVRHKKGCQDNNPDSLSIYLNMLS